MDNLDPLNPLFYTFSSLYAWMLLIVTWKKPLYDIFFSFWNQFRFWYIVEINRIWNASNICKMGWNYKNTFRLIYMWNIFTLVSDLFLIESLFLKQSQFYIFNIEVNRTFFYQKKKFCPNCADIKLKIKNEDLIFRYW